jgi:hypothetical protein
MISTWIISKKSIEYFNDYYWLLLKWLFVILFSAQQLYQNS